MRLFRRKHGIDQYIRQAIDNLTSGVCFFDADGILVLGNHQMNMLGLAIGGEDIQCIGDLHRMLNDPAPGVTRLQDDPPLLMLNGSVWQFTESGITLASGERCTQVVATDMTELYRIQQELKRDTERQRQIAEQLSLLQKNVVELARDEETLRLKMRIHDDIGRCVVMTRRLLQAGQPAAALDMSLWQEAVTVLQRDTISMQGGNSLDIFLRDAAALGIRVSLRGAMPDDERERDILLAAMRECLTNTVHHAGGDELSVMIRHEPETLQACMTNNGDAPKGRIVEGGGLSALRRRIEQEQGSMELQSEPFFQLTVTIPRRGGTH